MKAFYFLTIVIFSALVSVPALAKQVEVVCTTKAYVCSTTDCRWITTASPAPALVTMYRDPNFPKEGSPYELWYANYQISYDRHLLTLKMEVKDFGTTRPVTVRASLDAGNVIAEATGQDAVEISLRNQNYGRGFICDQIRAVD